MPFLTVLTISSPSFLRMELLLAVCFYKVGLSALASVHLGPPHFKFFHQSDCTSGCMFDVQIPPFSALPALLSFCFSCVNE